MSDGRIVFLDVDGTIIDEAGRIDPTTPPAIAAARRAGHRVMLCTGRALGDIHPTVLQIGFDGVISAGGAFVDIHGHDRVERVLSRTEATMLFEYFRSRDIPFVAQTRDITYADPEAIARLTKAHRVAGAPTDTSSASREESRGELDVAPLQAAGDDLLDHVAKLVFIGAEIDTYAGVAADLGDRFHLVTGSIPALGTTSGEVSAHGVNKGTTIEMLLPRLGFTRAESVGIGDSPNDLEMFAACGIAVAMRDAPAHVRAAADFTTSGVCDEGIHAAFDRLDLI